MSIKLKRLLLSGSASAVLLAAVLGISPPAAVRAEPSIFPTGTTRYDPAKAFNSYILFTGGDNISHLIDLNGTSVHEWKDAAGFSTYLDPALVNGAKGHIFVTLETAQGAGSDLVPGRVSARLSKTIGEVDWDGKPVWTFGPKAPGGLAQQHHDWNRLPNGNTLVLSNVIRPIKGFKQPRLLDDVIYEVNPAGDIVWTWSASDHLTEFGFANAELKLIKATENADYLHLNNMKVLGPNRWYAAGDKRFHPDNILIDSRNANFIAIIDRQTGKVVWNLGPHYNTKDQDALHPHHNVPRPVDQISGQHDAHIIPEGLPGAGNLLVFDNHGEGGYPPAPLYPVTGGSRVLEIDPVKKEIVWQYTAEESGASGWTFQSAFISSARRLPNGNTLIDEGANGRLFQITPSGEIVWEYVNPYPHHGKDPVTQRDSVGYQIYRAQPVPYGWTPDGTPHSEKAVIPPDLSQFRIPAQP